MTLAGNALAHGGYAGVGNNFVKCIIDLKADPKGDNPSKTVSLKIIDEKGEWFILKNSNFAFS